MESIMPFDELNAVTAKLKEAFPDGKLVFNDDYEDILDMLLDLFLLAFTRGNQITNMNLGTEWNLTSDDAAETVNKKVAGKTWEERVKEYFSSEGTVDDLIRIAETETHRDANTAALETAKKNEIPVQVKRYVSGGNDAARIQKSGIGVRCLALSAATRYLHAPVSVASVNDYIAMRRLILAMLGAFGKDILC